MQEEITENYFTDSYMFKLVQLKGANILDNDFVYFYTSSGLVKRKAIGNLRIPCISGMLVEEKSSKRRDNHGVTPMYRMDLQLW